MTYTILSILLARLASKVFRLPAWVTPASAFNNTTSLPLLLLQSLEGVGSLKLIMRDEDSVSGAIARAQSYFLLCGVISKTIGYIVGPIMLTSDNAGNSNGEDQEGEDEDEEAQGQGQDQHHDPYDAAEADEDSPLLASGQGRKTSNSDMLSRLQRWSKIVFYVFPKRVKQNVLTSHDTPMADIAIACTLVGGVLGLVPQLHKAFFNSFEDGGIFNAWLTSSIKNLGKLFTTLQIFIVGCELGVGFEKMKKEEDRDANGNGTAKQSSNPSIRAILIIFLIRLVVWPA